MNNQLINLQKLFNETIFRIPDYQRGYSWGNQQLEEFWDDLMCLLPNQDHYTGMLSYKVLDNDTIHNDTEKWHNERWLVDKEYEIYEIVDGQQRLTTLIILINEILQYCNRNGITEINNTDIAKIKEKYIYEENNSGILKTYKFGYEVDNPSYDYFRIEILGYDDKTTLSETFYTLNLSNAKDFFKNRIIQFANGEQERIEELFKKITIHLKFNCYSIKDDSNVFVAFETMNNRGKKLSYLELLKNRLIYLSTLFSNPEDEKISVRKEINEAWKEIYSYLGKNKKHPLSDDEFLQHHWIIFFGYNTRKTQGNQNIPFHKFLLGKYFVQQRIDIGISRTTLPVNDYPENNEDILMDSDIERENEFYEEPDVTESDSDIETLSTPEKRESLSLNDIQEYVRSLRKLIPYWYKTYTPTAESCDDISHFIFRLNALGFVNARPLVTVILEKLSNQNKNELIARCLKLIERFNFLHYRLNGYSSTYSSSVFYNLARDLYRNTISINDIIEKASSIDYLTADKTIDGNGVITKFEKLSKYGGFYSWSALKYILYIYDLSKTSTPSERLINPDEYFKKDQKDKYSVEHIYPQKGSNEYWTNRFNQYTDTQKKRLSGSLGNLLPLSKSINSSLQNDTFVDKSTKRFKDGSKSEQEVVNWPNKDWNSVCELEFGQWTPNHILDRGMKLLRFIENEFDFSFPSDDYRINVLGLNFMNDKIKETEEDSL